MSPPTSTCIDPAAAGTTTTFTDGTAGSYSVECYTVGFASASPGNYPSINIASGSLPSSHDITFAGANQTSCSVSSGGTTTTSGTGFNEEYITVCKIAGTPAVQDNGTYPLTFSTTPGVNGGTITTSGTLNLKIVGTAPAIHADQYFLAVAGMPFCFDFAMDTTDTLANGGLPLTNLTAGTTPANVTWLRSTERQPGGRNRADLRHGLFGPRRRHDQRSHGTCCHQLRGKCDGQHRLLRLRPRPTGSPPAITCRPGLPVRPPPACSTPTRTSTSPVRSPPSVLPSQGACRTRRTTTNPAREAGTITLVPLTSASSTVTTGTTSVFTSDNGSTESNLVGDTINSTGLTAGTVITAETSSGSPVQYTLTLSNPVTTTESTETVQVYYNSSFYPVCTESGVQGGTADCGIGDGGLGNSPTVVVASPLPTPIDPNANSTANLGSVDLDLGTDTAETYPNPPTGGCWGTANITLSGSGFADEAASERPTRS